MENGKNLKQVLKKVVMSKFGKMDLNKFITGDDSYWELRMSVDYVHSKIYEKNPLKDQTHMSMSMLPRVYTK